MDQKNKRKSKPGSFGFPVCKDVLEAFIEKFKFENIGKEILRIKFVNLVRAYLELTEVVNKDEMLKTIEDIKKYIK